MLEYILDAVKSHDGCSEEQHIHVPQEFFPFRWYFLQKSGSEITCSCQWWQETKQACMCVYVFRGQRKQLPCITVLQKIHRVLHAIIYVYCDIPEDTPHRGI